MKPAPFDYVRAETVDEALDVLAAEGSDARIIAGGQSLMAMLNMRLARPKVLVDIMRIRDLDRIAEDCGRIVVGAGVRQAKLLEWGELAAKLPLVALALPWTGHEQTRSRGTICGSIVGNGNAHPWPPAPRPILPPPLTRRSAGRASDFLRSAAVLPACRSRAKAPIAE